MLNLANLSGVNQNQRNQRGFTGHEHLDEFQLIHMNGRAYDYNLGQFYGVDPFVQFPSNSQSLNPYSYLMNNPLSGTDPTGYCSTGSNIKGSDVAGCSSINFESSRDIASIQASSIKDSVTGEVTKFMTTTYTDGSSEFNRVGAIKPNGGDGALVAAANLVSQATTRILATFVHRLSVWRLLDGPQRQYLTQNCLLLVCF